MNIVSKMKQDWNRRASHHARFWIATEDYETEGEFSRSGEQTAATILDMLAGLDVSKWHVLEIGCGIGRVLRALSPEVAALEGVDVSQQMIDQSKQYLQGLDNVETRENSGVGLETFADQQFDLVYSYIAFQHMPRPVFSRYLVESHRVLAQGGHIFFQAYIGERQEPEFDDTIALRVYEPDELNELIGDCGFDVVKTRNERQENEALHSWLVLARKALRSVDAQKPPPPQNLGWLQRECKDELSSMDAHLYQHLAKRFLAKGRRNEAIQTMREQVKHMPELIEAWVELTALLVEEGRAEEAVDVLASLNERHPSYLDAYVSRIQLLSRLGRLSEASRLASHYDELRRASSD